MRAEMGHDAAEVVLHNSADSTSRDVPGPGAWL